MSLRFFVRAVRRRVVVHEVVLACAVVCCISRRPSAEAHESDGRALQKVALAGFVARAAGSRGLKS